MPRYFNEHMTSMCNGLARGFAQPEVTLEGRDHAIADVAHVTGEDNLF